MEEKKYELNIDVRILELLGPNLYTNIYYVLAELIANAYDADAHNVYIFAKEDSIVVEDDGVGMSYEKGEVANYLQVAKVSRSNDLDSKTANNRLKMGRKGVGKLAALSVSENVVVKTISNGEKSGFILSRHPIDKKLESIPDKDINFERIKESGTSIMMLNPQYQLNKTTTAIKHNLLKIFPAINKDFRIHIIQNNNEEILESFDIEIANDLCSCILLGEKSLQIKNEFHNDFPSETLLIEEQPKHIPVSLKDNNGCAVNHDMKIEGWIGAYKTTRNRKKESTDFPDNFISIYAHDKMGEFNILPIVGKNALNEVYVVGQLYIDLFELSELPDMALSNRQGYKSDDVRYIKLIDYVRNDLLPRIIALRVNYSQAKRKEKELNKNKMEEENEKIFVQNVKEFKKSTTKDIINKIKSDTQLVIDSDAEEKIKSDIDDIINSNSNMLGLKPTIDKQKKKILISHTTKDKEISDIIYNMLLFNNVPPEDIIYTHCEDEISRIPQGMSIYDYLKKFFVDSVSDKKMYVIFVTSDNTKTAWGAMVEIGASWITQIDNNIFNINGFRPEHPLDDEAMWNTIKRDEDGRLSIDRLNCDDFCSKIENVCKTVGYEHKVRNENKQKLSSLIVVE